MCKRCSVEEELVCYLLGAECLDSSGDVEGVSNLYLYKGEAVYAQSRKNCWSGRVGGIDGEVFTACCMEKALVKGFRFIDDGGDG